MKEITKLEPLMGHTTPETAYVVDDYPYGFRLRCKIRYWLDFRPGSGFGFRLVSQTTNPKRSGEVWNKPKASTYCMLAIMGLDESKHVTWTGCNTFQFDELREFANFYGDSFDSNQKAVYEAAQAAYDRYQARKAAGYAPVNIA